MHKLISPAEAARRLAKGRDFIMAMIRGGELPAADVRTSGGATLPRFAIDAADIEQWLASRRYVPTRSAPAPPQQKLQLTTAGLFARRRERRGAGKAAKGRDDQAHPFAHLHSGGIMSDWLKLNQVAEHLGVSSETVRRMVARGELLGRKIGGVWKVHRTALVEYERPGLPRREQVKREGFTAGAGDELAAYRTPQPGNPAQLPLRTIT